MDRTIPVEEGAEAFVEMLNANNVEYIFLNPGTDTFPIQEALSKFKAQGRRTPEVILSLHESFAMTAAQGHFMISGRPQVVLVHVDVGTQNVGGALHNAHRGRIGVIFCAGRSPLTFDQGIRGERSGHVHWLQEQYDQGGIVRDYVKWDYELRTTVNINQVVQRAFQMATTEPCGPVYLTLPRELLMEKIESLTVPDVLKHPAPETPQADTPTLVRVAEMLLQAETPLIITGASGRKTESVAPLVELAEVLAVRVVQDRVRMNFPDTHPLCGGGLRQKYVKEADTLLFIDSDVPYIPHDVQPESNARIVHIGIDPIKKDIPLWVFPGDIFVQADSTKVLPVLVDIIKQKITPEQQSRFNFRAKCLEAEHRELREHKEALALSKAGQKPISAEWLGYCMNEVIDEDTIVLHELSFASMNYIQRTNPGTIFGSGGSSLGFGLGAALGAKLAAPDRTIVSIMGDGGFIFGCPIPTFWAANVYKAPFLAIISNNQQYHAARGSLRSAYGEQSYSEKTGVWVGVDIVPSPKYAMVAEMCGGFGKTIEDPSDLHPALMEALNHVRNGRAAILDVRLENP
ncbi:MAG: thiamine pyrophosphate-requiring protein [Dehalococcoidia bacterium]|nr:MAG: thiamine pyrophosphate-requiring protein [Dehalococcoidia bacterium]